MRMIIDLDFSNETKNKKKICFSAHVIILCKQFIKYCFFFMLGKLFPSPSPCLGAASIREPLQLRVQEANKTSVAHGHCSS